MCYLPETSNNKFAINPYPCDCKGTNMVHINCLKDITKKTNKCNTCGKNYNQKYVVVEYTSSPSDMDIKDACCIQ
jgi:excinuclease UvrABC ATPase subunit